MKYLEAKIECIRFEAEDIIATSSSETQPELEPIDPDEGAIV